MIVFTKAKFTTITIPPGSVVEVVRHSSGGFIDIQWEAELHMVPLTTLVRSSTKAREATRSTAAGN